MRFTDDITPDRPLIHGRIRFGTWLKGRMFPRCANNLYQEPIPSHPLNNIPIVPGSQAGPEIQVSIKRIYVQALQLAISLQISEKPLVEIARMLKIGDDVHVIGLIEAILTEEYLYIITPFCEGGSLAEIEFCPLSPTPNVQSEAKARTIFRAMLANLIYLRGHRICHRDIDPSNFLVTKDGRILVSDLAMSIKVPEGGVVRPFGRCGKPSYWPPEVLLQVPFDAFHIDLWACICTLFTLLIGQPLFLVPHPLDIGFRYCISGAFVDFENSWYDIEDGQIQDFLTQDNERVRAVLGSRNLQSIHNVRHRDIEFIRDVLPKIKALSPEVRELFHNCLKFQPTERWRLENVVKSTWVKNRLPG